MRRVVLSIVLVIALVGGSAASVIHGLNHESDHADHLPEMTEVDLLADGEKALDDCCDKMSGQGATHCLGDLVAISAISPVSPASTTGIGAQFCDVGFANLTLAVPTGPPKV